MSSVSTANPKPVGIWLLICCLTIYGMVVLGGVTRLTGSGLSMVDWQPVMGVLPPLNADQWEQAFSLYRLSPEYLKVNYHMDVEDFKGIFWFEYAHRVLGRVIGIIFLIPLIIFLVTRRINKTMIPRLAAMLILGGLQGLLGWYMVKSGLVDNPHVSQYRLTAHLGLALILYVWILWTALDLLAPVKRSLPIEINRAFKWLAWTVTGLLIITALSGGFVAGLKAGLAYNTFPLMAGKLIPDGLFTLSPLWRNLFENLTTVQFDHRLLATLMFVLIFSLWLKGQQIKLPRNVAIGLHLLLAVTLLQIGLGISTLLLSVPIPLAATHQAAALIVISAAVYVSHQIRGN